MLFSSFLPSFAGDMHQVFGWAGNRGVSSKAQFVLRQQLLPIGCIKMGESEAQEEVCLDTRNLQVWFVFICFSQACFWRQMCFFNGFSLVPKSLSLSQPLLWGYRRTWTSMDRRGASVSSTPWIQPQPQTPTATETVSFSFARRWQWVFFRKNIFLIGFQSLFFQKIRF